MERVYKPPLRRKPEGEKCDFSLQFHASRVPDASWDKLVISLVSVETGKIVSKTSRGHVRNGTCQWPDTLIESLKLTQNPSSRSYDDKLYKLVIQMGSLRVGILGETMINLSEFVNADTPETIALPLKNCVAGTILHVKIQCLTPKGGSREFERYGGASLDQEESGSISEDDCSSSGSQAKSIESSGSQPKSARTYLPNPQMQAKTRRSSSPRRLQRDRPYHNSDSFESFAYGNDSSNGVGSHVDASSFGSATNMSRLPNPATSRDLTDGQNSARSLYSKQHSGGSHTSKGWNEPYSWQSERTNFNAENGSRIPAGLHQKLEAAEATIQELRGETSAWERQARKLGVEVESLKQQLATERKNGAELKIETSALETECESLRSEIQQLKNSKLATKKWDNGEEYSRWEMEDSRRLVKALQEESNYEKELSEDLRLQLHKMQDSNSELVCAVTELEEALDGKSKEIERLLKANQALKEQLWKLQDSKASVVRTVTELEGRPLEQNKEVGNPFILEESHIKHKVDDDEAKWRLEEAEWDQKLIAAETQFIRALAEEEDDDELDALKARATSIEDAAGSGKGSEISKASWKERLRVYDQKLMEKDKEVKELTIKLNKLENKAVKEASKDDSLETADVLRRKLADQEIDLNELTEENIEILQKLSWARKELDTKEELILELEARLEGLSGYGTPKFSEDKQILIDKLELHVKDSQDNNVLAKQQVQKAFMGYGTMQDQDLICTVDFDEKYQKKIMLLEQENEEYKEQFRHATISKENLEAMVNGLQKQTEELELQVQSLSQERASIDDAPRKCDAELLELLQSLQIHMASEKRLESELGERHREIDKLIQELAVRVACEKKLEVELSEAEKKWRLLDANIQELLEERRLNKSRIEEFEFRLPILSEEIKLLNASKNEYYSLASKLEAEKADMQEKLEEAQEESRVANERLEELVGQMAALTTTLDSQLVAKRTLERKTLELERDKEDLETQIVDLEEVNVQLSERISGLEAQLRYVTEERESHKLDVETVRACSVGHQAENQRLEAAAQEQLRQHESQLTELGKQLMLASEESERNLQHRKTHEQELDRRRAEISSLQLSISDLGKVIVDLECHQSLLEQQLQAAKDECVLMKGRCASLEMETNEQKRDAEEKDAAFKAEMEASQHRANKAEESLFRVQMERAATVDRLQYELQQLTDQLSFTSDEKEKFASGALVEASELRAEKRELEDKLHHAQEQMREREEESLSLQKKLELEIIDMARELDGLRGLHADLTHKLEETQASLMTAMAAQADSNSTIQKFEGLLSNSDKEKTRLFEEHTILSQNSSELKIECAGLKRRVDQLSLEKSSLESSLDDMTAQGKSLQSQKESLAEKLKAADTIVFEVDEQKRQRVALEDKLLRFQSLLEAQEAGKAQEAEQRNELIRLKRHVSQVQRKLVEQEEEKNEFERRIKSLEEDLVQKIDALTRTEKQLKAIEVSGGGKRSMDRSSSKVGVSSPSRDSKEVLELRERLRFLEEDMKAKEDELTNLKQGFSVREADLLSKLEHLERSNEQLAAGLVDLGTDQLRNELIRLQNQNSFLSRREQDLRSKMHVQEVLQGEVCRLEEANDLLEARLTKFMETAKNPFLLEKIVNLETELAEAVEANNMYKSQLRSIFDKQQNVSMVALEEFGDLDQVIDDLYQYKKKATELQAELHSMHERYSLISLQLAEAEAERGELVITLKNLRSAKKP